jgi:putative acetyltransferase
MIEIRTEKPEDAKAIRQVHELAFRGPKEAMAVDLLRNRKKAVISLVAVPDEQLVGHILFSLVTVTVAREGFRAVGLAPVSVLPEFQKMGIGSRMIREGLQQCHRAGFDAVVVLGDPRYYTHFGFSRASDYQLDNEYNAREAFMVIELHDGGLKEISGLVKYEPEFRQAGC